MRSEAEAAAVEVDKQIRAAEVLVRAMPPAERDLAPLLALLGTEALRQGAIEHYGVDWKDKYELNKRVEVLFQETRMLSETEVLVATCERDWLKQPDVEGEINPFRGGVGYIRGITRTFRLDENGAWVNIGRGQDRRICKGLTTDYGGT